MAKQSTGFTSCYLILCVHLSCECQAFCLEMNSNNDSFPIQAAFIKCSTPLCSSSVFLHLRTRFPKPRTFLQGWFRYNNYIGSFSGLPNFPHKPQSFQMLQGGKSVRCCARPAAVASVSSGRSSAWHGSHRALCLSSLKQRRGQPCRWGFT